MLIAVHVYIVTTELLYPLQFGYAPLHWAARGGHTTCVEHFLSTPGIDVSIKDEVSWSIMYFSFDKPTTWFTPAMA